MDLAPPFAGPAAILIHIEHRVRWREEKRVIKGKVTKSFGLFNGNLPFLVDSYLYHNNIMYIICCTRRFQINYRYKRRLCRRNRMIAQKLSLFHASSVLIAGTTQSCHFAYTFRLKKACLLLDVLSVFVYYNIYSLNMFHSKFC